MLYSDVKYVNIVFKDLNYDNLPQSQLAVLTEVSYTFPQPLHANSRILLKIRL
jgi:hypothetical protein